MTEERIYEKYLRQEAEQPMLIVLKSGDRYLGYIRNNKVIGVRANCGMQNGFTMGDQPSLGDIVDYLCASNARELTTLHTKDADTNAVSHVIHLDKEMAAEFDTYSARFLRVKENAMANLENDQFRRKVGR